MKHSLLTFCWLARLISAQGPGCQPLADDSILGRDMAAVLPAFRQVPAETVLGSTPGPGSQRMFYPAEIQNLAKHYSIDVSAGASACFERAMESLDHARVLRAMQAALHNPDARIEIAEMSLYPVPRGRLAFTLERLGKPASPGQPSPVLWRGDVVYGDGHRYAIWARVRIKIPCQQIVAVENLSPGHPIQANQLRSVTGECFPALGYKTYSPKDVIGLLPLRPLPAGAQVSPQMLSASHDINRGDVIQVEVHDGAVRLVFRGRAESAGAGGDTIAVRNLESNRVFAAQVTGKGKAIVLANANKTSY